MESSDLSAQKDGVTASWPSRIGPLACGSCDRARRENLQLCVSCYITQSKQASMYAPTQTSVGVLSLTSLCMQPHNDVPMPFSSLSEVKVDSQFR